MKRIWIILPCLLAACASAPPPPPASLSRIDALQRRGLELTSRDAWKDAWETFSQAATLAQSVDDSERRAQAIVNQAWLAQRLGKLNEAASLLEQAHVLARQDSTRQEIALRRLDLAIRQQDWSTWKHWQKQPGHGNTPRLQLLSAEAALLQQQNPDLNALRALAKNDDNIEISGQAHLLLGRHAYQQQAWDEARQHAEASLRSARQRAASKEILAAWQLFIDLAQAQQQNTTLEAARREFDGIRQAWCQRFENPWWPAQCQP